MPTDWREPDRDIHATFDAKISREQIQEPL
jgi:hypothetical protein